MTPALAQRPLRTGEVHGRGPDPWDHYQRSGAFTPFTAICNVTGLPAVSLPLYQGDDGLPTGGPADRAARRVRTCCWRSRRSSSGPSRGRDRLPELAVAT